MASPTKTIFRNTLATRILLGVVLVLVTPTTLWAAEDAKRILALIDYIGGDYRNAVQDGKVINADEYQEMTEFSARSLDLFGQLKAKEGADKAVIEKELRALALHIKHKSGEDAVPDLARTIKERLITTYKIITHPEALPDLEAGKKVYAQNCAQCHGETGKGDGPGIGTMQRRPRSRSATAWRFGPKPRQGCGNAPYT